MAAQEQPSTAPDSEHARRLRMAHELGAPFTDHRIASFRADGERTLRLVDNMVRLNRAYEAALATEDLAAIEVILLEAEDWADSDVV